MTRAADAAVVVGFDASTASRHAVDWAAHEALSRSLPLHVVHVWEPPTIRSTSFEPPALPDDEAVLQEAVAQANRAAPGVPVTHEALAGPVTTALVEASANADTLVIGAHGHRRRTRAEFGSTAWQVCVHASCPVVVARALPDESVRETVVVGVDGSHLSDRAVEYAFAQAARRGLTLVAVHAWRPDSMESSYSDLETDADRDRAVHDHDAELAAWMAPWTRQHPDVPVRPVAVRRHPVDALLAEARRAQLLVVGSHGRGAVRGLVLGSVGVELLRDADCPVAVVRRGTH